MTLCLVSCFDSKGLSCNCQVERQGMALIDPSRYARELAAEEEKAHFAHMANTSGPQLDNLL